MSQQPTSMLSLLTDSSPTLLQPPITSGRSNSSSSYAFANSLSSPNSNTSLLNLIQPTGNALTDTNITAHVLGHGPTIVKQQHPTVLSRTISSNGTTSNSAGFAHPLPADFYLPKNIPQQVCILIDTTGGMRQYFGDFLKKIILPYLEQLKNNNTEYGAVLFQNHPPFGDFMVKVIPFIRQYNTFTSILEDLKEKFHAGGVCESCVTEAMAASLTDLQWEKECLKYCLICSSTPVDHPCTLPGPYSGKTASYLAREMAHKKGIIVSFVAPSTNKNWKPLFENSQIVHTSTSKKDKSKQENMMEDETIELRVVNGTIEGSNLSRNASNDEKIIRLILEKSSKTTSSKKELVEFKPAFIELRGLQLNLSQQNAPSTTVQPLVPLKTATTTATTTAGGPNNSTIVISSPPLGTTTPASNTATSKTATTTSKPPTKATTIAPKVSTSQSSQASTTSSTSSPEKSSSTTTTPSNVTTPPQQPQTTSGSTPPQPPVKPTTSPPQVTSSSATSTGSGLDSAHSTGSPSLHSITFSIDPNANALFTLDLIHNSYINTPDYPDQAKLFITKAPKACDIKRVAHQAMPNTLKPCLDRLSFFYLWKPKDEAPRFEGFYKTVNEKQFLIAVPVPSPPRDNEQQEAQQNVRFLVFITSELYKANKSKENTKVAYQDIPDKLFLSYVVDKTTLSGMVKPSTKTTSGQPSSVPVTQPPRQPTPNLQPATSATNPSNATGVTPSSQMTGMLPVSGTATTGSSTTVDASALALASTLQGVGGNTTRLGIPPNTFIANGMPLVYNPFFSQGIMMMPGGTQFLLNPNMLGGMLPTTTGAGTQPNAQQSNAGNTGNAQPNNAKK
ncbi:hypothetical protein C9374_012443 [Naegleria lovaniensis]|uniref:Mediator of RNA polymerase II transcription subunit 25 n=1 Tax=Naegleria lovaniensis TaxID=51637 RepID=A0AA88H131_NAELO|nr:uncharacterized protein C9374_012443 [Naegleria lovaniensis]KAG2392191.1 hypothetical protein C9374_012443 [Naegleria lovaniensis]